MEFDVSVFIFRRDLRLDDNTGLINALSSSRKVIPLFVFDKVQRNHDYFSANAFEFMVNSLIELKDLLKARGSDLLVLEGDVVDVLNSLKESVDFDAVFLNKDYTPFSLRRDFLIKDFCDKSGVVFRDFDDYLINPPGAVLNQQGEPYKVFTPFYKASLMVDVLKPVANKFSNYFCPSVEQVVLEGFLLSVSSRNPSLFVRGGSREARSLLFDLKNKEDYASSKDFVFLDATSRLSAHLKFGTVSIREAYWFVNDNFFFGHALISEFYWRDFFTHVAFFFPRVFKGAFREKYDGIVWWGSMDYLDSWKQGMTGFPIVDAAMRQLNETGWMHGRARMVVASFLVKNLGISWREGEKYFAQKLVDYDPCVNNGNWQWCASTGCDAQPYFRIFNPWSQQLKFDPDCIYIKRWVPELRGLDKSVIHNVFLHDLENYPSPIVDHKVSSSFAKRVFSDVVKK